MFTRPEERGHMRMAAGLVQVAVLLLASATAAAHAADPVAGGRYRDRARDDGARVQIVLTLANDGREFANPSYAIIETGDCGEAIGLASDEFQPAATPVRRGGRFQRGLVRGRFTRHGRLAVGTVAYPPGDGCPSAIVRFRARLTSTPNAPSPSGPSRCDRLTIRYSYRKGADDAYELSEHGIGCTAARGIARRWYASRDCAVLVGPGQTCIADGATCQRIQGGVWRPLAGVRCALREHPRRAVELVYHEACLPPRVEGDYSLWAINLDCPSARAFPFDELDCVSGAYHEWVPCASLAGYTCSVEYIAIGAGDGYRGRCLHDQTRFHAMRFIEDFGV